MCNGTSCELEVLPFYITYYGWKGTFMSNKDEAFSVENTRLFSHGNYVTTLNIISYSSGKSVTVAIGYMKYDWHMFYIHRTSQIIIMGYQHLQAWTLSDTNPDLCKLDYIWQLDVD